MKYSIEDLRNGKCAVINDGTLEELREVLELAFIDTLSFDSINFPYHFKDSRYPNISVWRANKKTNLPTQSVKDFLIPTKDESDMFQIYNVNRPNEISRRDYFAAMAMQSYISKYGDKTDIIKESVFLAEKMIAELDKPRK